jgi:hypothetical protein
MKARNNRGGIGHPATARGVVAQAVGVGVALLGAAMACPGASKALPAPHMTYLDNGEVRVGMDLALGGAVTFMSSREHPGNVINSADLGRQIQMSHYSGPWPFEPDGHKAAPEWRGLGWNPIQTGDCRMNPSQVVEHRNDGRELYIRCIPMQWPLDRVPGDCVFETWTTLEGPVVHMRFRCTNQRADHTFYRACPQELPAVYTVSTLSRLISYTGDMPFTGAPTGVVSNDWHRPWPWTAFKATERWAALVDARGWGLGVFKDDGGEFHGGIHGDGRTDNPKDGSTAYLAPIHRDHLDHNIVYEHRTEFMLGNLEEMRRRFNAMASRALPAWRFESDRQHWILEDATDEGMPLTGGWPVRFGSSKPRVVSPPRFWRAEAAPVLEVEVEYQGPATRMSVFWERLGDGRFDPARSVAMDVAPRPGKQLLRVDLSRSEAYRGLICRLGLSPGGPLPGGTKLVLRSVALAAR